MFKISEGVQEIGRHMIDNPHDWVQGMYEYRNVTNRDIAIWTSNGASFIKFNGNNGLNFREKCYLNRCIKKSIANKLLTPSK
mgnify:CR=1 FL=1|tara:strand:- start:12242 stop:12487 length:246 start_codon:yes stop_codon:yes gene_type:complete